jgi:hypothetical protein
MRHNKKMKDDREKKKQSVELIFDGDREKL